MRALVPILALAALSACTTSGTDDSVADGVAVLTMNYSFDGYVPDATDCQTAYAESLYVDLEHSSGETRLLPRPCDNTAIVLDDLQTGAWILELRTVSDPESHTGIWSTSPVEDLSLVDGENVVDLVLTCQSNCGE